MIDVIIILLLLAGFSLGLKIGFLRVISFPLGIVLGIFCGRRFSPLLAAYLGKGPVIRIVLFFLIFFLSAFLVLTLGKILSKLFRTIFLGWLDSLLGGALGLILSFLVCGFLLFLSYSFFPNTRPAIEGSGLARRAFRIWSHIPLPKPKKIETRKPVAEISLPFRKKREDGFLKGN
jgi:uncharacterized membrane protein required for colicin V production|uniref:CvpA family protein n=1 Tax=candidate division WOR-3 bacterium TaxID=2052148 RepID=A0A7C3UY11_UNCW3